jgi:predicted DNA binding protein
MSVIVELDVRATDFELGRVLAVPGRARIKLEALVPLGGQVIPLFWLYETDSADFVDTVRGHPNVQKLTQFDETGDRILYALTWDPAGDELLSAISDHGGYLSKGSGSGTQWSLQIRFPDHETLSAFDEQCQEEGIHFEIERVYNPTPPGAGEWYGLSTAQRETFLLALQGGYYDIPRRVTTRELGEDLGISDRAVIERLRRAIQTLADNTVLSEYRRE